MEAGLQYLTELKPWTGEGRFSLVPIRRVMEELGSPQDSYKTIHVAGTNGKGSVSTFVAAGLGAAGFRVGLNTSPHLSSFLERFVVDGMPLDREAINAGALSVKAACERIGVELTYHEAVTAIAFTAFKSSKVDYAVIEVGLGGRLDSSNILERPEAAVIVSIGLDHQNVLGASVREIAAEKGGIIKSRVPTVTGDLQPEAASVIAQLSRERDGPLFVLGTDFMIRRADDSSFTYSGNELMELTVSLPGRHQMENAAVSAKVMELLGLSCREISFGLSNAFWPARLEYVEREGKRFLIDCAHNEDAMRTLVNHLKFNRIYGVRAAFGALNTKQWRGMINLLMPHVSEWFILEPLSDAAVSASEISDYLSCRDIKPHVYGREYRKFMSNINRLDAKPLNLLTGSIYLVGELRSLLDIPWRPLWIRAVS